MRRGPRHPGRFGFPLLAGAVALALLVPAGAQAAFGHQATIGGTGITGGKLDNPQSVATDASGNFYVLEGVPVPFGGNLRVSKFNSAGTFLRAWGQDVVDNGAGNTGVEICTAAASCKAGVPSSNAGGFSQPRGIAVDTSVPNGNVYVTDAHRVQEFTSDGSFVKAWGKNVDSTGGSGFEVCTVPAQCGSGGSLGGLAGEMSGPNGLAIDGSGFVYVADANNHRVQRFNASTGLFDRTWGKDVESNGGGSTAFEICDDDPNPCKAGVSGGGVGEFNSPLDIAADASGSVYIADNFNHRVQKFAATGAYQRMWGRDVSTFGGSGFEACNNFGCQAGDPGSSGGDLNGPAGIAVDASANVYVADRSNNRAQQYSSTGTFQRAWGKDVVNNGGSTGFEVCTDAASCKVGVAGAGAGALDLPTDVALDASSRAYVVDNGNDRVQRFGEVTDGPGPGGGPGPGPGPGGEEPDPSNVFEIGKAKGKKVDVTVPGPGEIDVKDAKAAKKKLLLKPSSATATAAGDVTVSLRLTKTAKKKLKRKSKVKVKASFTYTPTGGDANTQAKKLKIKKKK